MPSIFNTPITTHLLQFLHARTLIRVLNRAGKLISSVVDAHPIQQARTFAQQLTHDQLIAELLELDALLQTAAEQTLPALETYDPGFRRSVVNLIQYLAFRTRDVRHLQMSLAERGLSSLGRSEAHIQGTLRSVLAILHQAAGKTWDPPTSPEPPIGLHEGDALLARHTAALFGAAPHDRHVRIMVTAPSEAAEDVQLLRELLAAGMDCLRINCAHDDPAAWTRMIANLRTAEGDTRRRCRLMMDLAGPKLRTGPVAARPAVVKWRPDRDTFGRILSPAKILLTLDCDLDPGRFDALLPMPAAWLEQIQSADVITFVDTRGANRHMTAVQQIGSGWYCESALTSYVAEGTRLQIEGRHNAVAPVGPLPPTPGYLTLYAGDQLVLTRSLEPGSPATPGRPERLPARIGCTLPAVFDSVRVGQRILFDDGKISGVVRDVAPEKLLIEITRARSEGARLRAEKGINLPDTDLNIDALTDIDRADLAFVATNADMVGFSFVRDSADVSSLRRELDKFGPSRPGIVLKIETRKAFEHLPELLFEAMRDPSCGIMIARGDLAVEAGYERLAEVQEEILWIAEAAHVPVIWATQVLETLAQTGTPSRSEITDAAMGERAECVMLNKGPHTVEAVRVLDDILRRMETHQRKKRSLLRRLNAWRSAGDQRATDPDRPATPL